MEDRSGFSVLCLLAGISVTEELLRVIVFSTSSSRSVGDLGGWSFVITLSPPPGTWPLSITALRNISEKVFLKSFEKTYNFFLSNENLILDESSKTAFLKLLMQQKLIPIHFYISLSLKLSFGK